MSILISILLAIGGLIALILIVALFVTKRYEVSREITIDVPAQTAFDYLKLLRNQDNFNTWVMVDPGMKRDFKGTDGTVGFIYGWDGNKQAGEGELELKALTEGKSIDTEIRFVRPFKGLAFSNTRLETISPNKTKVYWNNAGTMNYPINIMVLMIQKMLGKDMDKSLTTLKGILEKK